MIQHQYLFVVFVNKTGIHLCFKYINKFIKILFYFFIFSNIVKYCFNKQTNKWFPFRMLIVYSEQILNLHLRIRRKYTYLAELIIIHNNEVSKQNQAVIT